MEYFLNVNFPYLFGVAFTAILILKIRDIRQLLVTLFLTNLVFVSLTDRSIFTIYSKIDSLFVQYQIHVAMNASFVIMYGIAGYLAVYIVYKEILKSPKLPFKLPIS